MFVLYSDLDVHCLTCVLLDLFRDALSVLWKMKEYDVHMCMRQESEASLQAEMLIFASKILPTWKIILKNPNQVIDRIIFLKNKSNLNNGALHFCRIVYLRSWEWVRNIDEASILWGGYVFFITILKKHKKFKPFAQVQPQNYLSAGNRVQKFSAMACVPVNNYK